MSAAWWNLCRLIEAILGGLMIISYLIISSVLYSIINIPKDGKKRKRNVNGRGKGSREIFKLNIKKKKRIP